MNGIFLNLSDRLNRWPLDKMADILGKIKDYANKDGLSNVEVVRIEDNTWSDPVNNRYDIDIICVNSANQLSGRKLLILKDELLDGIEFHKRFKEFYN